MFKKVNMCSAPAPVAASHATASHATAATDDRSTQARIPDAALACFAEQGFRATTVRAIAARAGVSAALVIHHFGSKALLRGACDAFVSAYVRERKLEVMRAGPGLDPLSLLRSEDDRFPLLAYLARALHDDSLALHQHVERVLGVDLTGPVGATQRHPGYTVPALEILTRGLLAAGTHERFAAHSDPGGSSDEEGA